MRSRNSELPQPSYLLNSVAPSGKSIEPCVLETAQKIADGAIRYAERYIGDSCVAINLLEEAAARVSEVVRTKAAKRAPPIRDLGRYIYRVFLRNMTEIKSHVIECKPLAHAISKVKFDEKMFTDELLSECDSVTRSLIERRVTYNESWDEIASELGLSNEVARLRFSRAIQWMRDRLQLGAKNDVTNTSASRKKPGPSPFPKLQRREAFEQRLDLLLTPEFYEEFHAALKSRKNAQ